jgi:hypothetical protein
VSITEGPLLQTGGSTFFFWDNLGHPTDVGNCILGYGLHVDGPGVLAVVTFQALQKGGTSPLSFSYVNFSDVNLDSMVVGHSDGKVVVKTTAPTITSSAVTVGIVGQPYQYDVDATGDPVPTYALAAGYPAGMTINSESGLVQWTPAAIGDYPVTVEASNIAGTATQSFTIHVSSALQAPTIISAPVTNGRIGELYVYDVDATGLPIPTYALQSTPTPPAGMTIDAVTGMIQWTPSTAGDFDVAVSATNTVGESIQAFTIRVACCSGRVGDANGQGEYPDEITLGDIMLLVDVKFISSDCSKLTCLTEADVNQDGGTNPNCEDHVTLGDIMTLVDFLFITGPDVAVLLECL